MIQAVLEALIKHSQNDLESHIDENDDHDHNSLTIPHLVGIFRSFTFELGDAAAIAKAVIYPANLIEHGFEYYHV